MQIPKYYSDSVSKGILEAVKKGISAEDLVIVGGTRFDDSGKQHIIDAYSEKYWTDNKEECVRLFNELWEQGRIIQPRVLYGPYTDISAAQPTHIFESVEDMCNDSKFNLGFDRNREILSNLIEDGFLPSEPIVSNNDIKNVRDAIVNNSSSVDRIIDLLAETDAQREKLDEIAGMIEAEMSDIPDFPLPSQETSTLDMYKESVVEDAGFEL